MYLFVFIISIYSFSFTLFLFNPGYWTAEKQAFFPLGVHEVLLIVVVGMSDFRMRC